MSENECPCGSGAAFAACCEPIINQSVPAASAEQLMRSRYSAYVTGAVDWIIASNHADSRDEIDRSEIERWSRESTWQGLKIIDAFDGNSPHEAFVRFRARYRLEGVNHVHKERARFERVDGEWMFHSAVEDEDDAPQLVPVEPSSAVGRNDPCPCGSGKKFKRCCA